MSKLTQDNVSGTSLPVVRIIEFNESGHRLYYVRLLAEAASTVEWITSDKTASSVEADIHLSDLIKSGVVQVHVKRPHASRLAVLRRMPLDGVVNVITDGDAWLKHLAVLAVINVLHPRPFRVVLMRPPEQRLRPRRRLLRLCAKSMLLHFLCHAKRHCGGRTEIFALRDAFSDVTPDAPRDFPTVKDPVAPRPMMQRQEARESLGLQQNAVVVGLLGGISERKNPQIVADGCALAFADVSGQLLVAGKQSQGVRAQLEAGALSTGQLVMMDRYLTDDELASAASACDILALLYDNPNSASGILALASQAGAAVIVPRDTRLAATASRCGFGITSTLTASGASKAIKKYASRKNMYENAARAAAQRLTTRDFVCKLLAADS